jgi:fatty-acyl-CoA synthase
MRRDGYVNIVGRSRDVIIPGGENVYPREIEEFLYTHPRDQKRGGRRSTRRALRRGGSALVIAREPDTIDTETVCEFCRGKIAHF